jgi:glutamine cyclotransferase
VTAPFPIGVTVGANSVWVLNGNTGTVTRVDPTLDAVAATVDRVSMDPIRVRATGRAVWVSDGDDALIRIDPTTGRVVEVIPLSGLPTGLAVGGGAVWVGVDAT